MYSDRHTVRTIAFVPVQRCVHELEGESHLATGIVRDGKDGVVIVASDVDVGTIIVDLLLCYAERSPFSY